MGQSKLAPWMENKKKQSTTGSCVSCWQNPKRTVKKPLTQETTTWRAVVWAIAQSWWSVCPGWFLDIWNQPNPDVWNPVGVLIWDQCMLDLPGFNGPLKHSRSLHIKTQQLAAFLLNPQVSSYLSDLLLSCTCGQSKTVMMKEVQEQLHDVSISFRIWHPSSFQPQQMA